MAYTVVRVQVGGWRDRFKDTEDDLDFEVKAYPELDDYLCTMEERGWQVVDTEVSATTNGMAMHVYITLHRPDS